MAPNLIYVHIPSLAVRRRFSCEVASVTSALRQPLRERLNGAR